MARSRCNGCRTSGGNKAFFTTEDAKIAFNLFCCMYGISTLGMPSNFARVGPLIAVVALLVFSAACIYASVVCSRVMLAAPKHVKTYGDLGEWSMGKTGRVLVVSSQLGVCLLLSCAFLVLGGSLLEGLFPGAFEKQTWIMLMAFTVLPVCLIPTMKESAGVAFVGCLGMIVADVIGIAVVMHGMHGHPAIPKPDISFKQVTEAFGNLSLACGAAVLIPPLQRQHSDPSRMPRVIVVTLSLITVLFLIVAALAYSAVGCQISGTILFTMVNDPVSGVSALGFKSNQGAVVIAYLCIQMQITITTSLSLHPCFFVFERLCLGMHPSSSSENKQRGDLEAFTVVYDPVETPSVRASVRVSGGREVVEDLDHKDNNKRFALAQLQMPHACIVSSAPDTENEDDETFESQEYRGRNVVRYILLRITLLTVLVIVAVLLKDHFNDLADFIGASAITLSCLVLPIAFYLKVMWRQIPVWEKLMAVLVVLICTALGSYVAYIKGVVLFSHQQESDQFPFCSAPYKNQIYYVKP